MRGLYDDLRETREAFKRGQIDTVSAHAALDAGERRIAALLARGGGAGYNDEIGAIRIELAELRAVMDLQAAAPAVCIFRRPAREFTVKTAGGGESACRVPDLQVVRIGQVDFIEMDGRLRVRDWWELRVDGRSLHPPCEGPKRWVMKNAAGAEAMDPFGKPPAHMLLTGLRKRRALYKLRRGRRRDADKRKRLRIAKRAFRRAVARHERGPVMFAGIVGYIPEQHEYRHVLRGNVRLEQLDEFAVAPGGWPGRG